MIQELTKKRPARVFTGLSATALGELKTAFDSGKLQLFASNLYLFTELYVARARDLARENQKDAARDWFRFFENSSVCKILESFPNAGDLPFLKQNLKQLGLECHPLDVPTFQTDLQAIRHAMAEILTHVQNKPSTIETVSRFNPCRSSHRHHGPVEPRQ